MDSEVLDQYRFATRAFYEGAIVLDVGCGKGAGAEIMATVPGVARVIAVDSDPEAIRYARAHHARDNISFYLADVERWRWLPPCHIAVCLATLEYLEMPQRFIRKLMRATVKADVWHRKIVLSAPIVPASRLPGQLHDFSKEQIERWCAPWEVEDFEMQGIYGLWIFSPPVEIMLAVPRLELEGV